MDVGDGLFPACHLTCARRRRSGACKLASCVLFKTASLVVAGADCRTHRRHLERTSVDGRVYALTTSFLSLFRRDSQKPLGQPSFSGRGLPHSYTFHLFADGPLTGDNAVCSSPVFSSTPLRHPTFLLSLPFNQVESQCQSKVRTTRQPNNLENSPSRTADAPSEYRRQTAATTNPPADTDHHRENTRRRERAIDDQQLSASIN